MAARAPRPGPARRPAVPPRQERGAWTALSRRLIDVQEDERRRIARELHDEIRQSLSAIRVQFAKLQRRVDAPEARSLIDSAAAMTKRTLGRVRSLSMLLHPPQIDTLGLEAALRWHIDEQQRIHGVPVQFETGLGPEPAHPDLAIAAYRIVQEAVSNALRHASASRIAVLVRRRGGRLLLDVVDDGRGFSPSAARGRPARRPTLGLLSMVERARLAGGDATITSARGCGTRVAAELPWRRPAPAEHDGNDRSAGR
jgi:signal transduction histidine kinase